MKYYQSCDELPLKNFFKVIEEDDKKYLVKSDDYNFELKEDLNDLWESILKEYAELDKNGAILSRFKAIKEVNQLMATYQIVKWMLYVLRYKYRKDYIDDLALCGYKIEIIDNVISLDSILRAEQMSRAIINDIDSIKNELKQDDAPIKSNLFYTALAPLIKGYGNLDDGITVAKFVALRKYLKKADGQNRRPASI